MAFTLNQIAKKLSIEYAGIDTDSDYISQIEEWLNEAYSDLLEIVRWDFAINTEDSVTTVNGTAEYSLSTSVGDTTSCRITTLDWEIEMAHIEDMVANGIDIEETGIPRVWYLSGYDSSTGKNKVKFWPVPGAAYTIKFSNYKQPTWLSSFTTIPVPDAFIPVLKTMTRIYMSMDDGQNEDADRWRAELAFKIGIRRNKQNTQPGEKRIRRISDVPPDNSGGPVFDGNYPSAW